MLDLVVALARVLDIASAQCSTVAHAFPPQSADRTAMRMLTDALAKAAADLTGAAVRASRLG